MLSVAAVDCWPELAGAHAPRRAGRPAGRTRRARAAGGSHIRFEHGRSQRAPAQRASGARAGSRRARRIGHVLPSSHAQHALDLMRSNASASPSSRTPCGGEHAGGGQRGKRGGRIVARQHLGSLAALAQLQVLRDELEIDQAAAPMLAQSQASGCGCALGDAPAHVGDVEQQPVRDRAARSGRRAIAARPRAASVASPAIGARPGQRHVLPGPGLLALVLGEGREAGGDRPGIARRPQPHVDLVEVALGGRRGERGDQALAQPRVIGRRRPSGRAPSDASASSGAS